MDRKTEYSNTVDARKKEAENDVELEKYIMIMIHQRY